MNYSETYFSDGDIMQRKRNRLEYYDYSQQGCYFITICASKREKLFGTIIENDSVYQISLSDIGKTIEKNIQILNEKYNTVKIEKYIIMPNHIHLLIWIEREQENVASPTVSHMINQFKGAVTKQVKVTVWQKSFYDHVIRKEDEYLRVCDYIDNNPFRWMQDKYYVD